MPSLLPDSETEQPTTGLDREFSFSYGKFYLTHTAKAYCSVLYGVDIEWS